MKIRNQKIAYGVEEARQCLGGISKVTLYKLIASGELKSFQIGKRRLISHNAIRNFVREQETCAE